MDGLILGGNVLDLPSDVLFHLLRCGSGPGTSGDTEAHGNVWVLALGHRCVSEIAPNQHSEEKYPGDVRVLDEKSRNIAAITDLLFVCHCFIPLWDNLDEIAVFQTSGSGGDDFFTLIYTDYCYIALVGFTECHLVQMRHRFPALFFDNEHGVT